MGKEVVATGLGQALFSGTRRRLLELFFGAPNRSYYGNELQRLVGKGRGGLLRELENLVAVGLIVSEKVGNQIHYRANNQAPIFKELRAIVRKTFGLTDPIRVALEPLGKDILAAFIFGSIAKGTDTTESDVDVFVLSDTVDDPMLRDALSSCEAQFGREIKPVIYTTNELKSKLAENSSFITRILVQPKIPLVGDIDAYTGTREPAEHETTEAQEREGGSSGIRDVPKGRKRTTRRRE